MAGLQWLGVGRTRREVAIADESNGAVAGLERNLSWVVPAAVVLTAAVAYLAVPGFARFVREAVAVLSSGDLAQIRAWIQGYGAWSFAVIVAILTVQPLLVVVPSVLMMVVSVLAYGPVWGGLLAWLGSILAALVGYGLGWSLGPVTVDRLIGQKTERTVERYVRRYGFWAVVLFRLSPVLSTDAISIVAGLVGMRFRAYLPATALGFLPLAATIAVLGGDLDTMRTAIVWGSVTSVAAFAVYVVVDQWRQRE